jgi:hypothetical protein
MKGRGQSEDLSVDGRIILEWISGGLGRGELNLSGSGKGPVAGYCEKCNERSGSIIGGEFVD